MFLAWKKGDILGHELMGCSLVGMLAAQYKKKHHELF
jgi:hypothetical protein